MLILIAFTVFAIIFLVLFNFKRTHDDILRRVFFIREKYDKEILLEKTDVSCESSTLGLKNGKYYFIRCDLIFLKNAFVIIPFKEIGRYKLYSNLILIENGVVIGHGAIKRFNPNSINDEVYLEFGNSSLKSTLVTIRLKLLTTKERSLIPVNKIG